MQNNQNSLLSSLPRSQRSFIDFITHIFLPNLTLSYKQMDARARYKQMDARAR